MAHLIAVLPIGRIFAEDVALVTSSLMKVFTAEVIVAPATPLPTHARASDRVSRDQEKRRKARSCNGWSWRR
jgi:hypothetical protein